MTQTPKDAYDAGRNATAPAQSISPSNLPYFSKGIIDRDQDIRERLALQNKK